MVTKSELIKALDDKCVMYDAQNDGYVRVKSIYLDIWWHVHYIGEVLKSVYNGSTGNIVSDIHDMDRVFIKNSLLVFEKTDRSSAIGLSL